jgi:hypothetical protein
MEGVAAMDFNPWFERGFAILIVLLSWGAFFQSRRLFTFDERLWILTRFAGPDARRRIADAIARRARQERFDRAGSVLPALLTTAVGLVGFLGLISLPLLGALYFAIVTNALGLQLLNSVRTRSGARVAQLQRRVLFDIIPPWYLTLPFAALACVVYKSWAGGKPAAIAGAVIVCASVTALLLCFLAAQSPAIVGVEDPEADEAVDRSVRALRISELLFIAACGPFCFVELILLPHDPYAALVNLICAAAYGAMAWCYTLQQKSVERVLALQHA